MLRSASLPPFFFPPFPLPLMARPPSAYSMLLDDASSFPFLFPQTRGEIDYATVWFFFFSPFLRRLGFWSDFFLVSIWGPHTGEGRPLLLSLPLLRANLWTSQGHLLSFLASFCRILSFFHGPSFPFLLFPPIDTNQRWRGRFSLFPAGGSGCQRNFSFSPSPSFWQRSAHSICSPSSFWMKTTSRLSSSPFPFPPL